MNINTPEGLARLFHDTYERSAPSFGYETRADTKQFDASSKNGKLMVAVCGEIYARIRDELAKQQTPNLPSCAQIDLDLANKKIKELRKGLAKQQGEPPATLHITELLREAADTIESCHAANVDLLSKRLHPAPDAHTDAKKDNSTAKTIIDKMVDRFLGWKLPEDFSPDAGISFKAAFNEGTAYPMKHQPVGTNLLNADQARQMIKHMLGDVFKPLSTYEILQMYRNLPIADVEGIGEDRFENVIRIVERHHGVDTDASGDCSGDDKSMPWHRNPHDTFNPLPQQQSAGFEEWRKDYVKDAATNECWTIMDIKAAYAAGVASK